MPDEKKGKLKSLAEEDYQKYKCKMEEWRKKYNVSKEAEKRAEKRAKSRGDEEKS